MVRYQTLFVDYIGELYRLNENQSLEFGRIAELSLDDNRYLHRRLGRFEFRNGVWLLSNIGRSLHLTVFDIATQSQALVSPGRSFAFTFSPAHVRFRAGRTTYELAVTCTIPILETSKRAEETLDTITPEDIPLTPSQLLLIVALTERTLCDPLVGVQILPSQQVARRLRWTITKFNRKLDVVCAKLTKAGIPGLHGEPGSLASGRRHNLVVFAIQSGLVTRDNLSLLTNTREPL